MRNPSVQVITTEIGGSCLIINLANRTDTQIIWIDPIKGFPVFTGCPGYDIFPTEYAAMARVEENNNIMKEISGCFVMGLVFTGNSTLIFICTEYEKIGSIFSQHDINTIKKFFIHVIEHRNLTFSEESAIKNLSEYPLPYQHYFSFTYDLSSTLVGKKIQNCSWNRDIALPLSGFACGHICPQVIIGHFSESNILDCHACIISRIRFDSIGSLNSIRGTFIGDNIGNFASIEFVISRPNGNGYEAVSSVIFRSSTPICFEPNSKKPTLSPQLNIPPVFQNLFQRYDIDKINVVDMSHNGCAFSSNIDKALRESISFFKDKYSLKLYTCDWVCMRKQLSLDVASKSMLNTFKSLIEESGVNYVFIHSDHSTELEIQKTYQLITSHSGLSSCTSGCYFCLLAMFPFLISKITGNPPRIITINDNSNNILIELISQSLLLLDSSLYIYSRGELNPIKPDLLEMAPLESNELFYTSFIRKIFLSIDFQGFISSLPIIRGSYPRSICNQVNGTLLPSSHFLFPKGISPDLLSSYHSSHFIELSDPPVVLMLSEAIVVAEIHMWMESYEKTSQSPSSVSVYGGLYMNRTFPIIEDVLLPQPEIDQFICIKVNYSHGYSHHFSPALFTKVRFLMFKFKSSDSFRISNIRVYGTIKSEFIVEPLSSIPPPITNQIPESTFFDKEESRIKTNVPPSEYFSSISTSGDIPSNFVLSNILELYPSGLNTSHMCKKCNNSADFRCGMCRKYLCSGCSEINSIKDKTYDPKGLSKLCDVCKIVRTRIIERVNRLEKIKTYMIMQNFPFIMTPSIYPSSYIPFSNSPVYIPAYPLYEAPSGFDLMLWKGNQWTPRETLIPITLVLRQYSALTNIEIVTDNPFSLIFDEPEQDPIMVEPPGSSYRISLCTRLISFRIIGKNISIQRLAFFGRPTLEPDEDRLDQRSGLSSNVKLIIPKIIERSKSKTVAELSKLTQISGIEFSDLRSLKSLCVSIEDDKRKRSEWWVIPKVMGSSRLYFAEKYDCLRIIIWPVEYSQDYDPAMIRLIVS